MAEPAAYPQTHPWWARPSKLEWFGLAAGLGCVLATLCASGFALAQVLAELAGVPDGWTLRFLELGLPLLLVIPAQLLLPFFLRTRFDRIRDLQVPAAQASGSKSRALPMSNEAFWVTGISGLMFGAILVVAVLIFSDSVVAEKSYRLILIHTMVYLVGAFTIGVFFFLARGTDGLDPDEEAEPNE